MMSYSQQGEDMILKSLFQDHQSGFYVDVGAHHPSRFSNTYFFYLRGWRGINIDAMPGSMAAFPAAPSGGHQPGVRRRRGAPILDLLQFDEPEVNGFSPRTVRIADGGGPFRIIGER